MNIRSINSSQFRDHAHINLGDVINNNYYQSIDTIAHNHVQFTESHDQPLKGFLAGDFPAKTERFFGRKRELTQMRQCLQTTDNKWNGIALCGISGSGKTQIALEYIGLERESYSAILWINALSDMTIQDSFASCARYISHKFPPSETKVSPTVLVIEWLKSTIHHNWLVVVDGIDDLIRNKHLLQELKTLRSGTFCITTAHAGTAKAMGLQPLPIDYLDQSAAKLLILWKAFGSEQEPDQKALESARKAAKSLRHFPLALELAGILIQEGVVSLDSFPAKFEERYTRLANFEVDPGSWSYNRHDSMFAMIEDLYKSLATKNPSACLLLDLCCIYGSCEIPISLLQILKIDGIIISNKTSLKLLQEAFHDDLELTIAANDLHRVFLAKKKHDVSKGLLSITLHDTICRWRFETMREDKAEWMLQAAYILAKHVDVKSFNLEKASFMEIFTIANQFFSPLDRCLNAIHRHVPANDLKAPTGRYASHYFTICSSFSHIYLAVGKYGISKSLFLSALEYLQDSTDAYFDDKDKLLLSYGLAVSCYKTGNLSTAAEGLQSALNLAERIFGHISDEAVKLSSQLKGIREKISTDLEDRKRALVAATGAKFMNEGGTAMPTSSRPTTKLSLNGQQWFNLLQEAKDQNDETIISTAIENGAEVNALLDGEYSSVLSFALTLRSDWIVELLLKNGADVNMETGGSPGPFEMAIIELVVVQNALGIRSPVVSSITAIVTLLSEYGGSTDNIPLMYMKETLLAAATWGSRSLLELLIEKYHDNNITNVIDNDGLTPLLHAATYGHKDVAGLLLEKGANIEAKDCDGSTPLHQSVKEGYEDIVELLLQKGANIEARDKSGNTPLLLSSEKGYERVVKLLLAWGANKEAKDSLRETPLFRAIYEGHEGVVKVLLDDGANIEIKNRAGKTPLLLSKDCGFHPITHMLEHKIVMRESLGKEVLSQSATSVSRTTVDLETSSQQLPVNSRWGQARRLFKS